MNDEKGLLPEGHRSRQEKEPESVPIAESGVFDLALEDDQLVSQEGVLGDKLGPAAHRILGGSCKQRASIGLEHLLDALTHTVNGVENVRSEAMDDAEHALIAPGIWR